MLTATFAKSILDNRETTTLQRRQQQHKPLVAVHVPTRLVVEYIGQIQQLTTTYRVLGSATIAARILTDASGHEAVRRLRVSTSDRVYKYVPYESNRNVQCARHMVLPKYTTTTTNLA